MPATHVYGMMHNVPPTLSFTGNVAKNYRDWKKIFDNYMRATKQINDKDEDKIATLLNVAGNEAILKQEKILKGLSEEDQKDYGKVVGALKKYCDSLYEYNETYERFIFSRRDQQEGESFDSFYQAIQELVVSCNYPDQSKQLRDRIVQGTRDKSLQESLLRIKNLTEDVAAQQARSAETSRNQVLAMARCSAGESLSNEATVDSMKTKNQRGWNNPKQKTNPRANPNPNPQPKMTPNPTDEQPRGKFRCIKCDTHHPKFKCPAYGQTCGNCGRLNHLTKCCRVEIKQVAELKTNESDEDIVVLHHLKSLDTATEWRELIKIGNKQIVLKLDPGSDVNTLTWDFVKTLKEKENMRPCKTLIAPYGTSSPPIKAAGKLLVNVEVRGKQYMLDFLVVDDDVTPVLSKTDCERMGLVIRVHEVKTTTPQTKEEFVNSHKDSFQGTGKFPGKLKIVLQEGCKPKRSIPHRIPSAIKDKLKEALDDQEARGIIRKVQEITPATVINNLVITEKPDKSLRICLDPSELNKVILSRPHQVPTTLEIQEKLSGMKVFSVLDLKEGFYHCELDEESQMLCCFVTPWGIYCFQRLPFGLTSAPEEFQAINEAIFGDIEGVVVYIDDICCAGKNQAQHDKLKRLRLKILKYKFEIEYLPGTSMHMADHLSRNFLPETEVEDPEMVEVVHSLTRKLPVSKSYLDKLLAATENDLVIKQVIKYVMEGWPKQISKVPQEVKPFWQHQHDLYVLQGVLMKDHCIVIPKNLQKETVNQLHEGHAPSEKTIKRAKMSVYWPNFVRDITNFVDSCTVCGKFKPRKTPVELLQHEIPDLPWAKLGADLLSFGGKKYLIVMDYFSKWLEIIPVKSLSAAAVIEALKSIFFIHGDPQSIVCDNNPFNSNEFQLFAKDKFDLIFSSPTYAQSNGLAECAVGIAKKIMRKSHESKEDYRILLREQNSNPLSGMEHSPAQILYSRQIKTNIPTSRKTLEPKLVQKEAHKKMIENQQVRKTSHDKRVGRKPQIFKSGQSVNIRNRHETTWTPGTVIGQHQNPRSYLVKNSRGNIVRRNERHLSNAPSKLEYQSDYSDISSVVVPQDQPKFDVVNPMPVIQETPHCEVVTEFALIVPDYFYQMQQ
ncbi:hypothetical protein FOCC_FOCC015016 [Frankliniella occidentalis]|nr:hypothetical protein FOCC_FOCC015016 [Frankliniella occidentalis]